MIDHNSPEYYRESRSPTRDVLIERLCHRLEPLQPRVLKKITVCVCTDVHSTGDQLAGIYCLKVEKQVLFKSGLNKGTCMEKIHFLE